MNIRGFTLVELLVYLAVAGATLSALTALVASSERVARTAAADAVLISDHVLVRAELERLARADRLQSFDPEQLQLNGTRIVTIKIAPISMGARSQVYGVEVTLASHNSFNERLASRQYEIPAYGK